jgi:hypothetical protein
MYSINTFEDVEGRDGGEVVVLTSDLRTAWPSPEKRGICGSGTTTTSVRRRNQHKEGKGCKSRRG